MEAYLSRNATILSPPSSIALASIEFLLAGTLSELLESVMFCERNEILVSFRTLTVLRIADDSLCKGQHYPLDWSTMPGEEIISV